MLRNETAFGPYKGYDDNNNPKPNFEEASWLYKRNGKYYLEYAAGGVPEPNTPSANLQFDNWQFFKETTGLSTVSLSKGEGAVYDLQGRKVANSQQQKAKSLIIQNGKKVIR